MRVGLLRPSSRAPRACAVANAAAVRAASDGVAALGAARVGVGAEAHDVACGAADSDGGAGRGASG